MNIIIMGPPGSGKSTQAKLLAKHLDLPHLSTGRIFRRIKGEHSRLGGRVRERLERGLFVSDEDVMLVLESRIKEPRYKGGFILDGFPRNIYQARNAPFKVDKVFFLKVSDKESARRLSKRGRDDDTEALVERRLFDYRNLTEPVLDFYRERGILEEVDGERPIGEIFEDILSRLPQFKPLRFN